MPLGELEDPLVTRQRFQAMMEESGHATGAWRGEVDSSKSDDATRDETAS